MHRCHQTLSKKERKKKERKKEGKERKEEGKRRLVTNSFSFFFKHLVVIN